MRSPAVRAVPRAELPPRGLGDWARAAAVLESRAREALAILGAVRDSRLLVPPSDPVDRERQMTGVALIEMVEVRLRAALDAYEPPVPAEIERLSA